MTPYHQFSAQAFMLDAWFRAWVANPTPETDAFWQHWLLANPDKKEVCQRAKEELLTLWGEFDQLPEAERQQRINQIKAARLRRDPAPVRWWSGQRAGWAVAASLTLALGMGWLAYTRMPTATGNGQTARLTYQQLTAPQPGTPVLTETKSSSQSRGVKLPDGSLVTLSARSTVRYAPTLGKTPQRAVYLQGEAFFEVVKDPTRPFFVYANGVVTRVLGTSFRVSAYETTPNVTVQVRTGRVAVFANTHAQNAGTLFSHLKNGVVLTPNQQVVLLPNETLVKSIVQQPTLLHPDTDRAGTVYTDTPLSQIFQKLETSYGIEIVYDQATLRECLLTARLYDEPLLEQIALLCKTVGATYAVTDGRIVVSGGNCQ